MPSRTNDALPDILVVDNPKDIRLIFSEKHNRVLKLVTEKEMSISDIARSLNVNPGSAHYYLKELEKHGLVRQVREEIKGGIVKKYYRSAAKRILMDTPDFRRPETSVPAADQAGHLLTSIEYLGYHVSPENLDDAMDLLLRYEKRVTELRIELESSGLADVESNAVTLQNAYHLVMNIRERNDPEMGRMYHEFERLFLRCE
jgi:DNA-binding transcriptional ArsR family regulator